MRTLHRLSALKASRIKEPGLHADGGGLYLQVGKGDARSWIFCYAADGRKRQMGLGPAHTVGLPEARDMALEFTIVTAARTGEVLGARWEEIDFEAEVWTIPAERMKAGKAHKVVLSPTSL